MVWSTKYREPFITEEIKPVLLKFLKDKASAIGCRIFTFNAMNDHVHILLYIPPSLAISVAVNRLKGTSSLEFKNYLPNFAWQKGYGIFSLRRSELPIVQNYINSQEKHHLEGTIKISWEAPLESEI